MTQKWYGKKKEMKKKKKKEKMVIYVGYSINEPRTLQFTLVENKTKRDYWQREDDNTMMMTTVAKKEKKNKSLRT